MAVEEAAQQRQRLDVLGRPSASVGAPASGMEPGRRGQLLDVTGRVLVGSPGPLEPFCWVGAHGGAGATSLATGSGLGDDVTGRWPDPELGWAHRVAVVCRANAAGLAAVGRLLGEWRSRAVPDLDVLAVVAVADAPGRAPKPLRMRLAEVAAAAPTLLTVPWIDAWREHPYVAHPAAKSVADRLITLTGKEN